MFRICAEALILFVLLLAPVLVIGLRPLALGSEKPYLVSHVILTAILSGLYFFRGPISQRLKVDPSTWLTKMFEVGGTYLVLEAGLIVEMLKNLPRVGK